MSHSIARATELCRPQADKRIGHSRDVPVP